jgi:hypothetical protein
VVQLVTLKLFFHIHLATLKLFFQETNLSICTLKFSLFFLFASGNWEQGESGGTSNKGILGITGEFFILKF